MEEKYQMTLIEVKKMKEEEEENEEKENLTAITSSVTTMESNKNIKKKRCVALTEIKGQIKR